MRRKRLAIEETGAIGQTGKEKKRRKQRMSRKKSALHANMCKRTEFSQGANVRTGLVKVTTRVQFLNNQVLLTNF